MNQNVTLKYERTHWLTLEKRCLSLFSEQGYDLQSGVWFCFIESRLRGLKGLSETSRIFIWCLAEEDLCWPPSSDLIQRCNIIKWYIQHALQYNDLDYFGSLNSDMLSEFNQSLKLLLKHKNLISAGDIKFIEGYIKKINSVLRQNILTATVSRYSPDKFPLTVDKENRDKRSDKAKVHAFLNLKVAFFLLFFYISGFISYYYVQRYDNKNQEISIQLAKKSKTEKNEGYSDDLCDKSAITFDDSWFRLKDKIDELDKKIRTAESNNDYITLSELKTAVYDIKEIILERGMPVSAKLFYVHDKNKIKNDEAYHAQIVDIQRELNQLQCQLYYLDDNSK